MPLPTKDLDVGIKVTYYYRSSGYSLNKDNFLSNRFLGADRQRRAARSSLMSPLAEVFATVASKLLSHPSLLRGHGGEEKYRIH